MRTVTVGDLHRVLVQALPTFEDALADLRSPQHRVARTIVNATPLLEDLERQRRAQINRLVQLLPKESK